MRINEETVQRRLIGYMRFPRAFVYLLMDKKINDGDFAFYYQLVCLARFDKRNRLYSVVEFTSSQLAIELSRNTKTVRNHLNSLMRLGLIFKKESYFQIHLYEDLFTSPRDYTTKGNQRTMAHSLLSNNESLLDREGNDSTYTSNALESPNNAC